MVTRRRNRIAPGGTRAAVGEMPLTQAPFYPLAPAWQLFLSALRGFVLREPGRSGDVRRSEMDGETATPPSTPAPAPPPDPSARP